MPRARNREVLQKCSYAQATAERTWSSGESLLLLAVTLANLAFFPLRIRISHNERQYSERENRFPL